MAVQTPSALILHKSRIQPFESWCCRLPLVSFLILFGLLHISLFLWPSTDASTSWFPLLLTLRSPPWNACFPFTWNFSFETWKASCVSTPTYLQHSVVCQKPLLSLPSAPLCLQTACQSLTCPIGISCYWNTWLCRSISVLIPHGRDGNVYHHKTKWALENLVCSIPDTMLTFICILSPNEAIILDCLGVE